MLVWKQFPNWFLLLLGQTCHYVSLPCHPSKLMILWCHLLNHILIITFPKSTHLLLPFNSDILMGNLKFYHCFHCLPCNMDIHFWTLIINTLTLFSSNIIIIFTLILVWLNPGLTSKIIIFIKGTIFVIFILQHSLCLGITQIILYIINIHIFNNHIFYFWIQS